MSRHPLSLAALTVLDAGPAGQIRAAAAAGFRSVGLRLMPLLATDARVAGIPAAEREIETLLAETGLSVLEIGVFPILPEMAWDEIEAVLALSQRVRAKAIVCPVEDAGAARRQATLARLCDQAAAQGLVTLVEFNPYSACRSLGEAVALIEAVAHPNAALVIDVLHLSRSGGSPADLARVPPRLIRLVHLCDATPPPEPGSRPIAELRAESRTSRLLPGEGALRLPELLAALPADCAISIEAPTARDAKLPAEERARRALDATRALLARCGLPND